LKAGFSTDGSQWDHLLADGERFTIGEMEASVLLSPSGAATAFIPQVLQRPTNTTQTATIARPALVGSELAARSGSRSARIPPTASPDWLKMKNS
jgi:hypothetical protein